MTPRIKELGAESDLDWFSEELLSQLEKKKNVYSLDGQGPIFDHVLPSIIKCRYLHKRYPNELIFRDNSSGWNFKGYKNQQEAEKEHIGIKSYGGFPWQISMFMAEIPSEALIHFGDLGSVYLSKLVIQDSLPKVTEIHHHVLPIWLDYALSSELWGRAGKWTRFHQQLHFLFVKHDLLQGLDYPGYYPLKNEAQWLSKFGFQGRLTQANYDLILTWDFPLTALLDLEKVLARES